MNAVTKRESDQSVVADYGASLLQVISKAAADPNVDIEKMERLLEMQERVQARNAEQAFSEAMNKAQSEMRPIAANASNPQTRSRYASFDKLDRVLRPIYTEHGFSLSFDEGEAPRENYVRVLCYVSHVGGHTRTYRRDMPADGKGAKGGDVMTKTHAAGAAGSYGARYLLKGIFNVAVGEDDDDGNESAARTNVISDAQWAIITDLIEKTGSDARRFCEAYRIESVRALPATAFNKAKSQLERKLKEMGAKSNG